MGIDNQGELSKSFKKERSCLKTWSSKSIRMRAVKRMNILLSPTEKSIPKISHTLLKYTHM